GRRAPGQARPDDEEAAGAALSASASRVAVRGGGRLRVQAFAQSLRPERLGGRTSEHLPVDVETRAVAGAVPGPLRVVPVDRAPPVRALRRERVESAA